MIPAYNEAHRIGGSLDRVIAFLAGVGEPSEIIVVDDGSRDATPLIVEARRRSLPEGLTLVLLRHRPNRGKGAAVREGCLAARGRDVLFTDADLATPIEEAQKLWAELAGGADLAIGSRVYEGRDMRSSQPRYRRMLGRIYHALVALLAVRGVADTQCGFKAFTREAGAYLFSRQQLNSIVFDTELLFLASRAGMRMAQVPVAWSNVGGSRMRVTVSQAVAVLADLLSIRFRHLRRRRTGSASLHWPPG